MARDTTTSSSSAAIERCEVGSKRRIDSTSSPRNSSRGGRSQPDVEGRRGRDDDDGLARGEAPRGERPLRVRLALAPAAPQARLRFRELDDGGAEEPEIL